MSKDHFPSGVDHSTLPTPHTEATADTDTAPALSSRRRSAGSSLLKAAGLATALAVSGCGGEVVLQASSRGGGEGGEGGNTTVETGGTGGTSNGGSGGMDTGGGGFGGFSENCTDEFILPDQKNSNGKFGYSIASHKGILAVGSNTQVQLLQNTDNGYKPFGPSLEYGKYVNSVGLTENASGKWLAVGSIHTHNGAGGVTIYEIQNDGSLLTNSELSPLYSKDAGADVAIHENTLVFGDPLGNSFKGTAHVASYNGQKWEVTKSLTAPDGFEGDSFGRSVSLAEDGTIIVGADSVGDSNGDNVGATYVFFADGNIQKFQPGQSDIDGIRSFGSDTAISPDGKKLIIGDPDEDNDLIGYSDGSAYTSEKGADGTFLPLQKIANPIVDDTFHKFGSAVGINNTGDKAINDPISDKLYFINGGNITTISDLPSDMFDRNVIVDDKGVFSGLTDFDNSKGAVIRICLSQ